MALREDVDCLNRLLEVALNLGGGLGSRVRNAEGMQREGYPRKAGQLSVGHVR